MNPATATKRPHGKIRQSQVITTFGPGALVDLPNYAAIVGGLEFLQGVDRQIADRCPARLDSFSQPSHAGL